MHWKFPVGVQPRCIEGGQIQFAKERLAGLAIQVKEKPGKQQWTD